jgi:hypothetical protein
VLSLAPDRTEASTPEVLCGALAHSEAPPALVDAVRAGLERVERALHEAFPENLFCDFDALVTGVVSEARRMRDPAEHASQSFDAIAELHHTFGRETPIHFRYVHDFIYGFDWAHWVAKDPRERARVGPYDRAFIHRMRTRGAELIELIERDDPEYPRLDRGQVRNPFRFARDPDAEERLFRDLARRELLPVEAWRTNVVPRWDRPFRELRARRAEELGL